MDALCSLRNSLADRDETYDANYTSSQSNRQIAECSQKTLFVYFICNLGKHLLRTKPNNDSDFFIASERIQPSGRWNFIETLWKNDYNLISIIIINLHMMLVYLTLMLHDLTLMLPNFTSILHDLTSMLSHLTLMLPHLTLMLPNLTWILHDFTFSTSTYKILTQYR